MCWKVELASRFNVPDKSERNAEYPLLDGELSGEVAVHSDRILDMGLSAITDILCAELEMANVSQANKLEPRISWIPRAQPSKKRSGTQYS